jgi:hypothetical protein
MPTTWNDIRSTINSIQRADDSWRSQKPGLLKIIEIAEAQNLQPAGPICESNLSSMLGECKRAVRWKNYGDLQEIINKAANLSNIELRLALHLSEVEDIPVVQQDGSYLIRLNEQQFNRVKSGTKARHVYHVRPTADTLFRAVLHQ